MQCKYVFYEGPSLYTTHLSDDKVSDFQSASENLFIFPFFFLQKNLESVFVFIYLFGMWLIAVCYHFWLDGRMQQTNHD